MKAYLNYLTALLLALMITSSNVHSASEVNKRNISISDREVKSSLQAHIEFLADDFLNGRATGSPEYEIAARYVASHFKQFGLNPAGENNTWFQSVPFIKSTVEQQSLKMVLHHGGKKTKFKSPEQFVALPNANSVEDEVRGELVFVGYGIDSKAMKYNDYADLDVKGKVVVMLAGRPASFPSEEGAHVGDLRLKFHLAEARGAVGVIMLHTPQEEQVKPYHRVVSFTQSSFLNWRTKEGGLFNAYPGLKALAYIPINTGEELFSAAGSKLDNIFAQIDHGEAPVGFDMGIEASLSRKSLHETVSSSNVIGVLEGSDPELKHEYVVFTAHLDHLGNQGEGSDTINNGALDNASGIAIMLETARRFSAGERPKRSIMFVAVTAEEKGLLGSNYFVHNPPVPTTAMIANINLDMPLILYPFADIVAFGAQHSTLQAYVASAAMANNLFLSEDPMPEQALFVRSDHYSFVKKGIPSIFLAPGFNSKDPKINVRQRFGQFFKQHYHQPSDDVKLPINYEAGLSFTNVNFTIGQEIANSLQRPSWNKGDFFGDQFKK